MEHAVEIRLLGALSVRREDGSTVSPRAWRTNKTRHLLRILALHAGAPVPADWLVETLWPDVEPAKGRGSLRMAVSQVRQIIGKDRVTRQFDGLVLQHVWVDAVAFSSLAAEARRLFAHGELADGLATAQEATALYGGDLCAEEPYVEWAVADREALRTSRVTLLAEAAEAAVTLGRHRMAIHLAEQAIAGEAAYERAYRVLMRTHARMGEADRALGAYERCRARLAESLGADPSPETRALHLELLSTDPNEDVRGALVGRETELQTLRARITDALVDARPTLVVVSGTPGSGRTRLADDACAPWSDHLVSVPTRAVGAGQPRTLVERLRARLEASHEERAAAGGGAQATVDGDLAGVLVTPSPLVVRVDDLDGVDPSSLERVRRLVVELACPLALVVTTLPLEQAPAELVRTVRALEAHGRAVEISLGALPRETVADFLAHLFTEPPSSALLDDVMVETGGYAGPIVELVRDLTTAGQLTVTRNGVDRLGPETTRTEHAEARVQRVRADLTPAQVPVFDVVSVLGGPLTVSGVAEICALSREEVRRTLDALVEAGILIMRGTQYQFCDPTVADAAYHWLRRGARRQLHEMVAASPAVSDGARIEHWEAAGEPDLAFAAAMQAARQAAARSEYERQRAYAVHARALAEPSETDPRDQLVVAEALGDACYALGRSAEAHDAFQEAVGLARVHAPGEVARLSRKLGDAANPAAHGQALGRYRQALTEPSEDPVERVRTTSAIGSMLALRSPVAAANVLRNAVGMADDAGDVAAQVEARVLLAAHALAPMRRFSDSEQLSQEALALADRSQDNGLLAQGLLANKQATIPLGSSWQTVATLTRVDDLAGEAGEPGVARDAQLLLALSAHELGAGDFARRWEACWEQACRLPTTGLWLWVPGRVLYERGRLVDADEVLARSRRGIRGAFEYQMVRLPAARLAAERGDLDTAVALLTAAVDHAAATGVTAALPEMAARLAAVEAGRDPAAAAVRLDQAEAALGETVFARERPAIMLGRAALLFAHGCPHAAADMAGAASAAARAAGLVFVQAEALTMQARYLTAADDPSRALTILDRARQLYVHADAPARLRATGELAGRLGLEWETGAAAR